MKREKSCFHLSALANTRMFLSFANGAGEAVSLYSCSQTFTKVQIICRLSLALSKWEAPDFLWSFCSQTPCKRSREIQSVHCQRGCVLITFHNRCKKRKKKTDGNVKRVCRDLGRRRWYCAVRKNKLSRGRINTWVSCLCLLPPLTWTRRRFLCCCCECLNRIPRLSRELSSCIVHVWKANCVWTQLCAHSPSSCLKTACVNMGKAVRK